jgi:hypothetical protein
VVHWPPVTGLVFCRLAVRSQISVNLAVPCAVALLICPDPPSVAQNFKRFLAQALPLAAFKRGKSNHPPRFWQKTRQRAGKRKIYG